MLLTHEDFRTALEAFVKSHRDILRPNTSVFVRYESQYKFEIYADDTWDSSEENIKGVKLRVRQLAKRELGDTL